MNKIFLHIEGFAVLLLSLIVYGYFDFSWFLFIVLLFAPDLSMLGYLLNQKVGAFMYNLVHTYTTAIGVILVGMLLNKSLVFAIGLILAAHIGMDRMLGYGLKYTTAFKDTHLQKV